MPQAQHIPMLMAMNYNRLVGKAVNLFYADMLSVPAAEQNATTGGTQIYRQEINGCGHKRLAL
jgi:hypothetical protein